MPGQARHMQHMILDKDVEALDGLGIALDLNRKRTAAADQQRIGTAERDRVKILELAKRPTIPRLGRLA